jgi:hypothetical protein
MTLDLSEVTDALIGLVKSEWQNAPIWSVVGGASSSPTFTPTFTGLAPDAIRQASGPQLSVYLYHVEPNNAQEALFWQPQLTSVTAGQPTSLLPLALDLFYLLFAYSESSYSEEQEAMSVALRIFHANPIVRSDPGAPTPWELTLTPEHRSYDELSRLWQATTVPLRMSLVYRAAVVFIDPDPMPAAGPDTSSFTVQVGAASLPPPEQQPVLLGTVREGSTVVPAGDPVPFTLDPATAAAGQSFRATGSYLGVTGVSDHVYLLSADGGEEVDVTDWVSSDSRSAVTFVVTLPATVGTPPAFAPEPGTYQLRVGSGAAGTPGSVRSGAVPLAVAARVDASGGPVLHGTAPLTVSGAGFVAGSTRVLVGTVALSASPGPPGEGEFTVSVSGSSFAFSPPPGAGAEVPVRVIVNGVESDRGLWVSS